MGKIAIITDLHFGIRKNSEIMLDSQKRFFLNQFYPYLRENNIHTINVLGDIFDRRDMINVKISNDVYDIFNNEFQYNILVGNHDCYYNTTCTTNSLKFLRKFSNVNVFENTIEYKLFDRKVLFVPWIFDNDKFLEDIKKSDADVCFGHFDVNGFSMGGKVSDSALMPETFNKFKKVFSGHFHTPQVKMFGKTEFVYCGSPYQMDWGEVGQRKGFYIFDTDTLRCEFIENTVSAKHIKLTYGEDFNPSDIANNYVKVFIKESETENEKKFDAFTKKVTESNIASVATVVVKEEDEMDNDVEISEKGQTLLELISEYIGLQESIENKKDIQGLLEIIYTESLRE